MAFDSNIKGYMTFGKSFSRGAAFPLEAYEIWTDYDALVAYAANTDPNKDPSYIGQKVAYVDKTNNKVTHYGIEIDGTLKELGASPIGDEKSIVIGDNNTISLKGIAGLVFERDILGEDGEPTGQKENVQFQPLMTKDGLIWVEPSKTTVEGLAALIDGLTARVSALENDRVTEQELADAIAGVEAKIEAVDFVDEDELAEAIKDFATDTEVATAVATEKERAEAAEKALGERIDAIDFVDADELATALDPYAKTADVNKAIEEVNTEVATKAKQTDLEALQNRVDAFLTGEGTEAALDSLQELIAYIESHDDVDIAGIMEDIQAIEDKLVGVDGTVAEYVTAAINALNIGDYAKASDLTDLAGKVAALEAKPFESYATKAELEAHAKTAAETYATKDELTAHEEAAAETYATKEELTAHEEAAAETYATKEELAAHEEAAEAAYATKAELEAHAEAAEAAYATKDELKATDDVAKDAQNRVGIVEGKIDEITSVGGEPNVIEKIKVNGVTLEVEKDAEGKSTKTVSIAVPTSIVGMEGYSALDSRVTKNTNDITALQGQLGTTDGNVSGILQRLGALEAEVGEVAESRIDALEGVTGQHTKDIGANTNAITVLNTETIPALQQAINNEADARAKADQAINTKIGTVEEGKTVVDMINAVAGTIDFTPYAKKDEVAATYATIAALEAIYKAGEGEAEATGVLAEEIARAKAAEKDLDDAIKLLTNGAGTSEIDSVKELIDYVNNHGATVEGINDRLDGHDTLLAGIGGEGQPATVVAAIEAAKYTLPGATATILGGIKSAADVEGKVAVNKVYVDATTNVAEVKAFSTDNLVQGNMTLVLNGGDAQVTA